MFKAPMVVVTNTITVNTNVQWAQARIELEQILDAGARSLKPAGIEMLPIKREMLFNGPFPICSPENLDLILDALNLLFAAILSFENAQWNISHATDPLQLVNARIESGRARAVVESLFFGPTRHLLLTAMDRAPIAFYAMSTAAPDLHIIEKCQKALELKPT
jgi:hypothetical protein